jgi:uncharacterized protein YbcC (UPF0753/DUF2309 family)
MTDRLERSTRPKVAIVKSAFDLMVGCSPVVLFIGHGHHSANNAFGLGCGRGKS